MTIKYPQISISSIAKIFTPILLTILVIFFAFVAVPNVYFKTDNGILEKAETVVMETNFGNLNINLSSDTTVTRKNFLSLSHSNVYDNNKFHRLVEMDGFYVLQGGQVDSSYPSFEDEIWSVKPEYVDENKITQKEDVVPVPIVAKYYNLEYNKDAGVWYSIYKKGTLVMANSGPDTNTTQFFIVLDDTKLQPNYAAFGQVKNEDFIVLDKIRNEVDPINIDGEKVEDGSPNQDIVIKNIKIGNYTMMDWLTNKFRNITIK